MEHNAGGTTAVERNDTSPALADFVGEMYGDYSSSSTVAGPEDDAPSSGAPEAGQDSPATPEGSDALAPADAPSAESAPTAEPDPALPAADSDSDPLVGASPLAYTVDGQQRTHDGITVLKDGGAIVDPDAVADLQRRLGERDHLYETSQATYQKHQELERLTTWKVKDAQGVEQTLTGRAALQVKEELLASALATIQSYQAVFNDPAKFEALVDVQLAPDGQTYRIVASKQGMELLKANTDAATMRATMAAQRRLGSLAQPPAPTPATPQDLAASAQSSAAPTLDQIISQHKLSGLTPADRELLLAEFPRYVVAQDGKPALDPRYVEIVKHTAALRAEQAKVATAASTSATRNAGKLAAAALGKRPPTKPATITPANVPVRSRQDDFDEMYDRAQAAAAGALRGHTQGL